MTTSEQELVVDLVDGVLTVTFNRPAAMNAMTWVMWEGLRDAARRAATDDDVRAMVVRGAGGAFVAGTDITQFADFSDGSDGVAYEERIAEVQDALERVPKPTIAVIDGVCVGGGLLIAAVCDIRLAAPGSRFGAPMARTLGNCLSMNSYSLLLHHLGPARTLSMLLEARLIDTTQAAAAGFVREVPREELDQELAALLGRLGQHAPLSMGAAKEAVRRLRVANLPDGDDLVASVFGSEDFRTGVRAFTAKETPQWTGR